MPSLAIAKIEMYSSVLKARLTTVFMSQSKHNRLIMAVTLQRDRIQKARRTSSSRVW